MCIRDRFTTITQEDLSADIDFAIVGGSTMPQNKNAMLDLIIRLAQTPAEDGLPMVDRETVLAYTSIADKKKILNHFRDINNRRAQSAQQDAQKAEQQMLMQMQIEAEKEQAKLDGQKEIAMLKEAGKVGSQIMSKEANKNQSVENITDEQIMQVIQLILTDPQILQMIVQAATQQ